VSAVRSAGRNRLPPFAISLIICADTGRARCQSSFPSDEEQARISKPYLECLNAAAERIDDGHSDLAVVAKAVATACRPQFDQILQTLGQTLTAEDRRTLETSESNMQIGYAAVAVGRLQFMRRGAPHH
jgi:hypothetical protein